MEGTRVGAGCYAITTIHFRDDDGLDASGIGKGGENWIYFESRVNKICCRIQHKERARDRGIRDDMTPESLT